MSKYLSVIAIVLAVIAVVFSWGPKSGTRYAGTTNLDALSLDTTLTVGTTSTLGGKVTADGGILLSDVLSTSTPASMTLAATDLANYSSILMLPTVGSITVTLPASSTLSSLVPTAGDVWEMTFVNSTTTNAQNITLAGGTGTTLYKATTTAFVAPGQVASLKFIRKTNTDIGVFYNVGY